jgi:hypothetical protein
MALFNTRWRIDCLADAAAEALQDANEALTTAPNAAPTDGGAAESLADIEEQWLHTRRTLPQIVADIFTAKLRAHHAENDAKHKGKLKDLRRQVERMVQTWRTRETALSKQLLDVNSSLAHLEEHRRSVRSRIVNHKGDRRTTPQQHAAETVQAKAEQTLQHLRRKQIHEVVKANDVDRRGHIDQLKGVVLACIRFVSTFKAQLHAVFADYDRVRAEVDHIVDEGGAARDAQRKQLRERYLKEVFEPLLQELERHGVAPATVRITIEVYADTPDLDPFCEQRCAVAEEALTRLLKNITPGTCTRTRDDDLQAAALKTAKGEVARLRETVQHVAVDGAKALLGDDAVSELRSIRMREAALSQQLRAAEDQVAKLSTAVAAVAELPPDPEETQRLIMVVAKVRDAGREIQEASEAAERIPHTLKQMAADQCRDATWQLLKAAERSVGRAVEIAATKGRVDGAVAADLRRSAAKCEEDTAVVEAARAARRPQSFTDDDVTLYAMQEEQNRVDADTHAARVRRAGLINMREVALWVVNEGVALIQHVH